MAYLRAADSSIHKVFLNTLPATIKYVFAYGSGVFKQIGHQDEKVNMLDYIIVADNPLRWHEENLLQNPNHYSFLRYGGAKFITEIQRGYGAGVYFNTLVKFENRLVKYGVIATEDLKDDLINWRTLYISGRLHKPVLTVHDTDDNDFHRAMLENLKAAVRTAILLLPDTFSDKELFMKISNLSYGGDFRMIFGEDKNKVRNLVLPHLDKFHEVYRPLLPGLQELHCAQDFKTFQQDSSPTGRLAILTALPSNVKEKVIRENISENRNRDTLLILEDLAHGAEYSEIVEKACREIVSYASWWQSVKGIFTAGEFRSQFSAQQKPIQTDTLEGVDTDAVKKGNVQFELKDYLNRRNIVLVKSLKCSKEAEDYLDNLKNYLK